MAANPREWNTHPHLDLPYIITDEVEPPFPLLRDTLPEDDSLEAEMIEQHRFNQALALVMGYGGVAWETAEDMLRPALETTRQALRPIIGHDDQTFGTWLLRFLGQGVGGLALGYGGFVYLANLEVQGRQTFSFLDQEIILTPSELGWLGIIWVLLMCGNFAVMATPRYNLR